MRYIVLCVDCALTGRYVTWLPGARLQCWMLLTVYTLPQLAVSAKILCLLMFVICGVVPLPSSVRSVHLFNYCSHGYVSVLRNGTVMAVQQHAYREEPNLTMSTWGPNLELLIHSPARDKYLCFVGKKLVGRRMTLIEAQNSPHCLFKEEFVNGYNRYHLVNDKQLYIGFNRRGVQLKRRLNKLTSKQMPCLDFMKVDSAFNIDKHNRRVSGNQEVRRPLRNKQKHRPAAPLGSQRNAVVPCHSVRHHHHAARHPRRPPCTGL